VVLRSRVPLLAPQSELSYPLCGPPQPSTCLPPPQSAPTSRKKRKKEKRKGKRERKRCPIGHLGAVLEEKHAHPDRALSLINRAGRRKQVMGTGERPMTLIDHHQYIFDQYIFEDNFFFGRFCLVGIVKHKTL